jgi:hypothetical protein
MRDDGRMRDREGQRVLFGYGHNYLIDAAHAVIVDVEATPARTYDEGEVTRTMLERTRQRFGVRPNGLAANTGYGIGRFLAFVLDAGIVPHIPVWDTSKRNDGTFFRSEFRFDRRRNAYVCPAGERIERAKSGAGPDCRGRITEGGGG